LLQSWFLSICRLIVCYKNNSALAKTQTKSTQKLEKFKMYFFNIIYSDMNKIVFVQTKLNVRHKKKYLKRTKMFIKQRRKKNSTQEVLNGKSGNRFS